MAHTKDAFEIGNADAALAASIFHFKEIDIMELKAYLRENNIPVRI
jgi:cyclase